MPGTPLHHVRYAPGPGVLLGAGGRWLLADLPDADDPALERVWERLTAPVVDADAVLAAVKQGWGAAVSLVLLDLTPGAGVLVERGSAGVAREGDRRLLTLGDRPATPRRRIVSGVVAATAAEVTPAPRGTRGRVEEGRPSEPTPLGLIDGVPPEILNASAPASGLVTGASAPSSTSGTPASAASGGRAASARERVETTDEEAAASGLVTGASAPSSTFGTSAPSSTSGTSAPSSTSGTPDSPVHTTYRPDGAARLAVTPDPEVDHLRESTHETVLAVRCAAGHLTPALTANCRVCHAPVPPQQPDRVPRPRLGVLRLPDGTAVPLDRGVVFGRQPGVPPSVRDDWPQLVRLPSDNSYVSRNHLHVELDGWLVLATDLGSRSGTTLRAAGREPERIRAGDRYIWEPGQVLDLADSYEILYEVQPDDAEAAT